jgi:6-phosphofructokinase 1
MPKRLKRIGILTSGGDCPGMNAAIRAVVREALDNGVEVCGFRRGFAGLIDNDCLNMDITSVGGILQRGGTILLTARYEEFKQAEAQRLALENIDQNRLDGLVVIGGDGSLRGAHALDKLGVETIGVPASIDNDIYGTDMALGVDTALNNIVEVVDKIKVTATSHERTFIIEVMGRGSGYLALISAITTGAEAAIIPEVSYDLEKIAERIKEGYKRGKTNNLIIVAEGAGTAFEISHRLERIGGIQSKITVLGHLQRGGSPSCFDRLLGSRFGTAAVEALDKGDSGKMVGLHNREIRLIAYEEVFSKNKMFSKKLIELAELLGR